MAERTLAEQAAAHSLEVLGASLQAVKPPIKIRYHSLKEGGEGDTEPISERRAATEGGAVDRTPALARPDCVEVCVRELVDTLLYDPDRREFVVDRLPPTASAALVSFYSEHGADAIDEASRYQGWGSSQRQTSLPYLLCALCPALPCSLAALLFLLSQCSLAAFLSASPASPSLVQHGLALSTHQPCIQALWRAALDGLLYARGYLAAGTLQPRPRAVPTSSLPQQPTCAVPPHCYSALGQQRVQPVRKARRWSLGAHRQSHRRWRRESRWRR